MSEAAQDNQMVSTFVLPEPVADEIIEAVGSVMEGLRLSIDDGVTLRVDHSPHPVSELPDLAANLERTLTAALAAHQQEARKAKF